MGQRSQQKITDWDGAGAKFARRQRHGLPPGTAGLHTGAVVFESDAEEYESIPGEVEDVTAVTINVNVLYAIGKDENGLMAPSEDLLPAAQAVNIFSGDPAFKAGQPGKRRAPEFSALHLGNNHSSGRWVEQEVKAFELCTAKGRPFVLIYGDVPDSMVDEPVLKSPLIDIWREFSHLAEGSYVVPRILCCADHDMQKSKA